MPTTTCLTTEKTGRHLVGSQSARSLPSTTSHEAMLTSTFTNDRDVRPTTSARAFKAANICPEVRSSEDEVLWKDYADRVITICETVRIHDRYRKATGNAGDVLLSTPSQFHGLDKIVKVNHDTQTALVEANVTMETLVKAVQPLHLTPTVVAESKSTTVADAFAATTNASSSSRYGTFDCTVMTAGVVLGNGHFVSSSINDPDRGELLQRSAGAFHSLGITTMLEIALVKAGPYVEVTYTPVSSILEMVKRIVVAASQSAELESSIDFVEGILLDRCKGMIVTGRRVLNAHRKPSQALATVVSWSLSFTP
ncbi:hypothetical protein BKA63DRAFT_196599 [Paraphoma chrysanthemicola]|nr:hypothetical protein BKA63DRAFT_196599 [Paraphoma chrysanthemicola]